MHFEGDLIQAVTCTKDAIAMIRGGDYLSRELYDHVLFAAGHFNALRPSEDDKPVIGDAGPLTLEDCCDKLEAHFPAEGAVGLNVLEIAQLLFRLFLLLRGA